MELVSKDMDRNKDTGGNMDMGTDLVQKVILAYMDKQCKPFSSSLRNSEILLAYVACQKCGACLIERSKNKAKYIMAQSLGDYIQRNEISYED
ncbi:hypothetical protein SAMN05443246_1474 [Paenibacillus sp. GP183]|nr:hypothetical protein SAMN05443246_1474 [Paenibacillus sp. GP183]